MIDKVGGRLDHAPGATAGAETPPFAAEGNQVLVAAAVALDAQETMFQQAALQVTFELLAHELWQVTP